MTASLFALRESAVVAAGAGTGKTHGLITLCLHLLAGAGREAPLPAGRLCAITFTEKAAAELSSRLRARVERLAQGEDPQTEEPELCATCAGAGQPLPTAGHWQAVRRDLGSAQIGTIHALCAQILRRHAASARVSPGFTLLDETDAAALLREACESAALSALHDAASPLREPAERLCTELGFRAPGRFQSGLAEILMKVRSALAESGAPLVAPDFDAAVEADAGARAAVKAAYAQLAQVAGRKRSDASDRAAAEANAFFAHGRPALDAAPPGELSRVWSAVGAVESRKGKSELGEAVASLKDALDALLASDAQVREARLLADLSLLTADAQARHSERKRRATALDFDDLTRLAQELLARDPQARRQEKARIGALLVDEFQDTSRAQIALIGWLAEAPEAEGHAPGPIPPGRLVLVGDRKQSIYEFRGADVASAQAFAARALREGARAHTLRRSRRSRPNLVQLCNALFAGALSPGGLPFQTPWAAGEDDLEPHRPPSGDEPCAELIDSQAEGPDAAQEEAWAVARRIAQLLDPASPARVLQAVPTGEEPRPVRGGDIAILLRAFTHVDAYRRALLGRRIPHLVWRGRGFFAAREVTDLLALLQLATDPDDVRALATVLRSPLGPVSDEGLVLLARGKRDDGAERHGLARRALGDAAALAALAPDDADAARRVDALLTRLQRDASVLGPSALLESALAETDYLAAAAAGLHGEQAAANVDKLLSLARTAELRGSSAATFVQRAQALAAEEAREADAAVVEEVDPHAVRILTVHAAKGLEFPVVFIPGCGAQALQGAEPALLLEADLGASLRVQGAHGKPHRGPLGQAVRERLQQRELAQSRRLFYVAATRARDLVVFSSRAPRGKDTWRSWLDALLAAPEGARLLRVVPADSIQPAPAAAQAPLAERHPSLLAALQQGAALPGEAPPLPPVLRDPPPLAGETVVAPVTQLADAMLCARRYQLLHELRLPERQGQPRDPDELDPLAADPAELGTLAHRLLERAVGRPGQLRELCHEEGVDPDAAESREVLAAVSQLLSSPLGKRLSAAAASGARLQRELPFALRIGGEGRHPELIVRGQIDALLLEDQGALVLDYKLAQEHHSARYDLQLDAYALAAHELLQGALPVRTALVWLRSPGAQPKLRPPLDAAGRAALRDQLGAAAGAIAQGRRDGDFPIIAAERCRAIGCGFLQRCHGRAPPVEARRGQLALPL